MTPISTPETKPIGEAARKIAVDMSPAAIDRRLRELEQLWQVWRFLRKFQPVDSPKTPHPATR